MRMDLCVGCGFEAMEVYISLVVGVPREFIELSRRFENVCGIVL